jgi:hypothetical protein
MFLEMGKQRLDVRKGPQTLFLEFTLNFSSAMTHHQVPDILPMFAKNKTCT